MKQSVIILTYLAAVITIILFYQGMIGLWQEVVIQGLMFINIVLWTKK